MIKWWLGWWFWTKPSETYSGEIGSFPQGKKTQNITKHVWVATTWNRKWWSKNEAAKVSAMSIHLRRKGGLSVNRPFQLGVYPCPISQPGSKIPYKIRMIIPPLIGNQAAIAQTSSPNRLCCNCSDTVDLITSPSKEATEMWYVPITFFCWKLSGLKKTHTSFFWCWNNHLSGPTNLVWKMVADSGKNESHCYKRPPQNITQTNWLRL